MALNRILLFLTLSVLVLCTNTVESTGSTFNNASFELQDDHGHISYDYKSADQRMFVEILENEEEQEQDHYFPIIDDFKKSKLSGSWLKGGLQSALVTHHVNPVRKHIILQVFRN